MVVAWWKYHWLSSLSNNHVQIHSNLPLRLFWCSACTVLTFLSLLTIRRLIKSFHKCAVEIENLHEVTSVGACTHAGWTNREEEGWISKRSSGHSFQLPRVESSHRPTAAAHKKSHSKKLHCENSRSTCRLQVQHLQRCRQLLWHFCRVTSSLSRLKLDATTQNRDISASDTNSQPIFW